MLVRQALSREPAHGFAMLEPNEWPRPGWRQSQTGREKQLANAVRLILDKGRYV